LGGAAGGANPADRVAEELRVDRRELLPLAGDVVLVEDRGDRAHRLARAAVDALVGLDVEHPPALVDAVHRALVDAGPVLHVDAGLADRVGHGGFLPPISTVLAVEILPGSRRCATRVGLRLRGRAPGPGRGSCPASRTPARAPGRDRPPGGRLPPRGT